VDAGGVVVSPMPTGMYGGRVVVLTGPGTIGSAEFLVLALRDLGNVTVIGEPTAGSLSPMMARIMPNGWSVGLSNTRVVDAAGTAWNTTGIPPDEVVPISIADLDAGRDPVLERAEEILAGA
jgi:C-terminal processing protease CtpA/Prc